MPARILVTAFEAFGGEAVNPSLQVLRELRALPTFELQKLELPVCHRRAPQMLLPHLGAAPDLVLMLGEAGGRRHISPEQIAVNCLDFPIPDNSGLLLTDQPVVAQGPAAYFSSLPLRQIEMSLKEAQLPCQISNSAGLFLCNQVFYQAMHYLSANKKATCAGFVHLPWLPEQLRDKPEGSYALSLADQRRAVECIIQVCLESAVHP